MSCLTRRSEIFILLVFSVTSVSCQLHLTGFIGEDVLLPCVYRGDDSLPQKVFVYWRDKDDKSVLYIRENVPDFSYQNQVFRGRVESFPDLYKKGNFSILLNNLQQSDSGLYECSIPATENMSENFAQEVVLRVSGKRVVVAETPPPAPPSRGNSAATLNSLCVALLSVPLLLCTLN